MAEIIMKYAGIIFISAICAVVIEAIYGCTKEKNYSDKIRYLIVTLAFCVLFFFVSNYQDHQTKTINKLESIIIEVQDTNPELYKKLEDLDLHKEGD